MFICLLVCEVKWPIWDAFCRKNVCFLAQKVSISSHLFIPELTFICVLEHTVRSISSQNLAESSGNF